MSVYERWLFELWHGDYDVAHEIIADGFVGHWPDREVQGREALVDRHAGHPHDLSGGLHHRERPA